MNDSINKAIKLLANKVSGEIKPDEALKYTQAALNLAHVQATIANTEYLKKQ